MDFRKLLGVLALCAVVGACVLRFGASVLQLVNGNVVLQAMFGALLMQCVAATTAMWRTIIEEHVIATVMTRVRVEQAEAPLLYVALRQFILDLKGGSGATTRASTNLRALNWHDRQKLQANSSNRRFTVQFLAVCRDSIPLTCMFQKQRVFFTCDATSVTVSALGRRAPSELQELVQDMAATNLRVSTPTVDMYCVRRAAWERQANVRARFMDSVMLPGTTGKDLVEDAQRFFRSQAAYNARHQPHRRGYTLYGPPGCGKTSLAHVLASECDVPLCAVALQGEGLTDADFHALLRDAPSPCILLLEDVDVLGTVTRTGTVTRGTGHMPVTGLTLSGILNALDGICSQEGRLVVATTNCLENVDAALLRPARCGDRRVLLSWVTFAQARDIFVSVFPDAAQHPDFITALTTISKSNLPPCRLLSYLSAADGNLDTAMNTANLAELQQSKLNWSVYIVTAPYEVYWSLGLEPAFWHMHLRVDSLYLGARLGVNHDLTPCFQPADVLRFMHDSFPVFEIAAADADVQAFARRVVGHVPAVSTKRLNAYITENAQSLTTCLQNADRELFAECPPKHAPIRLQPLPKLLTELGFDNAAEMCDKLLAEGIGSSFDLGFALKNLVECSKTLSAVYSRLTSTEIFYMRRSDMAHFLEDRFGCTNADAWAAAFQIVPLGNFLCSFVTCRAFYKALFACASTTPADVVAALQPASC